MTEDNEAHVLRRGLHGYVSGGVLHGRLVLLALGVRLGLDARNLQALASERRVTGDDVGPEHAAERSSSAVTQPKLQLVRHGRRTTDFFVQKTCPRE